MHKRIVTIGGGTGNFVVLSGLKNHEVELQAIVTTADSGGSSGILRDEYGVLPPGDIRQCLVALSDSGDLLRELFLYRFDGGPFHGHNFGNIFLSALEKISGDVDKTVDTASRILNVRGRVIPVTKEKTDLSVELENGETIFGETHIDEPLHDGNLAITRAHLVPAHVTANPQALAAIQEADLIVIGPGDIYTSIIPVLLVPGIRGALLASRGKKAYIMNLMTKFGQTNNMGARSIITLLEHYLGGPLLTDILINSTPIPEHIQELYATYHEYPILDDLPQEKYTIHRTDLLSEHLHHAGGADTLKRSILRHSPEKIASLLTSLLPTA